MSENIKSGKSELTDKDLSNIVGGINAGGQNNINSFTCPVCSSEIPISMHQVLFYGSVTCIFCGVKLEIKPSSAALDKLHELSEELNK